MDADHDPDLLWAVRGGGGHFGIVIAFRLQVHRVEAVTAGTLFFPTTENVAARIAVVADALSPWAADVHYANFSEQPTGPARFHEEETAIRLRTVKDSYDPAGLVVGAPTWTERPRLAPASRRPCLLVRGGVRLRLSPGPRRPSATATSATAP